MRWLFILDVEQASADRSRSSGTLSKTVRSIFGEKHTKSILHDVILIENEIVRVRKVARSKSYWIILRLRSGEKLSVCPSGLSEMECQKISRAIADILNIEPPAIPQY